MDKKRRLTNKYILLAILLIAVFVLPSCRTRISNNSEITNVQYDEDGFMSETYQMRRDELGLSTAEKPLLPNFGSAETDDNDDFSEGESIDYNPEDFQEDFTEPETNTNTNTNTNTSTNTGTRGTTPRNSNSSRSSTRGTTTTTTRYTITFDANGGIIKETGKEIMKIKVKKGNGLGTLPDATKNGVKPVGWYTSKTGGTKVDTTKKVTSSTTYFAHWPESGGGGGEEAKKITVTLNYNDDGKTDSSTITVTEGGKYEGLNDPPARGAGYTFKGWFDGNGNRVKNGDAVNPNIKSLKAEWDYSPKDFWNAEFEEAANSVTPDDKKPCYVIDSEGAPLIDKCKGDVTSKDDATYIIQFIAELDDEKATNAAADIKNSGEYPNAEKVVLIDKEAIKAKDNKEIIYKMMILEELYGNGVWAEKNAVSKAKGTGELETDGVKPITKQITE